MLADCFGIQIHPAIPWILAIAAAARWLVTAGSMARGHVITARAVRRDHGWTFGFGPASPTSRER